MKLKKAKRLAAEEGFNYVAVDESLEIWAYRNKPKLTEEMWGDFSGTCDNGCLGDYTGNKDWKDTLTKITGEK